MKTSKTNERAYDLLHKMERINDFSERSHSINDVFLLPSHIDFDIYDDCTIKTYGLGERDRKVRDLVRVLESVEDALNLKFTYSNVLTPLMYAESLENILWHITTQAILYVKINNGTIQWIKKTNASCEYGKHGMDKFWLPCNTSIETLKEGEVIGVFNRRVAGWDGSQDRPVIELLGTGGHLPTVLFENETTFRELSITQNIQKEAIEELGTQIDENNIHVFGGYINSVTHELVILAGVEIDEALLPEMQNYAVLNLDDDTKGIYLGRISDVISDYQRDPEPYAGGLKAAPTNFPNQKELMNTVVEFFKKQGA